MRSTSRLGCATEASNRFRIPNRNDICTVSWRSGIQRRTVIRLAGYSQARSSPCTVCNIARLYIGAGEGPCGVCDPWARVRPGAVFSRRAQYNI